MFGLYTADCRYIWNMQTDRCTQQLVVSAPSVDEHRRFRLFTLCYFFNESIVEHSQSYYYLYRCCSFPAVIRVKEGAGYYAALDIQSIYIAAGMYRNNYMFDSDLQTACNSTVH